MLEVKLIYLEKVGMSQFDCGTDGFSILHEDVPLKCLFQCGIITHPDQQSLNIGKTRTRRSREGKVKGGGGGGGGGGVAELGEGGELCIQPQVSCFKQTFPPFSTITGASLLPSSSVMADTAATTAPLT